MCVSLFFQKPKFFIKQLVRAFLENRSKGNIHQTYGTLQNIMKFFKLRSEAAILRCSATQSLHENTSTEVSRYKGTSVQVFSSKFWEAFRNTFFPKHLWWSCSLSLKKFYIVGVCKKVFEWLVAKEFLSNSNNYLRPSCASISCFSIFCIACFFY